VTRRQLLRAVLLVALAAGAVAALALLASWWLDLPRPDGGW
jgi:hypothetical protein